MLKLDAESEINILLDAMQEGVVEMDADYRVVRFNKVFAEMLGLEAGSIRKMSGLVLSNLLIPVEEADTNTIYSLLKTKEGAGSGFCQVQSSRNEARYFKWSLKRIQIAGFEHSFLSLSERTECFELKAAIYSQFEDFLALLNHRLRTPVIAARRIINLMIEGEFGKMTESQERLSTILSENMNEINRLMLMIMDIYRYRNSTKNLNFGTLPLESILSKALSNEKLRGKGPPINVQINCPPETKIKCDENEFVTMLSHLLENASKFARSKVEVHVELKNEEKIFISILDDGKGIAEPDRKNLFSRFYVSSSDGKYAPCTGAGLCLCAEIAKAHGGAISCDSAPEQGTKFQLSIPIVSC
ncbi:MAG: PAS domain-containing sensor histidine kinase [Candidatus Obscuribacterales bacterium]|nr:PAS domain-containing sensor histidine kinase [Candidatus Obscuribacterales bacterium]